MEKGVLHKQIRDFFVRNFDVRQEKENELETVESIKKGIEFKGTNLWVLIFATFVASLGLNTFDGRGNFACGIKEQIIFPEIDFDKVDAVRGMDVCFVTTAKTDEEGKELLKALGAPFATENN